MQAEDPKVARDAEVIVRPHLRAAYFGVRRRYRFCAGTEAAASRAHSKALPRGVTRVALRPVATSPR
jgi:hypothetical protein